MKVAEHPEAEFEDMVIEHPAVEQAGEKIAKEIIDQTAQQGRRRNFK